MRFEQITLSTANIRRFAFRFAPEVVRVMIPSSAIGKYLLIDNGVPVYIGRSDRCTRTRLSNHPLLGNATHFVWERCRHSFHAFCLEAFWFHRLQESSELLNTIHPARPANFNRPCPFCCNKDIDALRLALGLLLGP